MDEIQRQQAIREINDQHRQQAIGLGRIAEMMLKYCRVLRGEEQDLTGLGIWRIIVDNLERVMNVKIKVNYDS